MSAVTMTERGTVVVTPATPCPVDAVVAGVVLGLVALGVVMVASASSEVAARSFGDSTHLLARHLLYVGVAVSGAVIALAIPVIAWQRLAAPLLVIGILLLVAVLVPGVGREANGAVRWIAIGPFNLQGSEFVKLLVVVYLASYLVTRAELKVRDLLQPLFVVGLVVLLLLGQPDFGSAVVIVGAVFGVMFLAGTPLRYVVPVLALGVAVFAAMIWLQPYRLARLVAFTDPWAHQYGGGYQLTQALIAFGRGDWFGLGLGNSIQKLFFLPEAHTDFLFSIVAEELGIVGAAIVMVLFAVFVIRALFIGSRALAQGRGFHGLLAFGIALLIGLQALINLGVNLGTLPTKGLTLPFMSYGGNSLIVSCLAVGVLLRIELETRIAPVPARGGRGRGRG